MTKTKSITRNQNDDDDDASSSSSSRKRFKRSDDNGVALWSDVNHDVLFLVMKQLGVVDFVAFSGVCKSWRSFAVSNKNMFMASLPPMSMWISSDANKKDSYCHFEDFERRKFKTILPHYAGRICVGLTCGYLILFGRETRDFWLVNPITRHELHFTDFPLYIVARADEEAMRGMLVFSPSISEWAFVVVYRKLLGNPNKSKMLCCIAGKRRWNHVSSTPPTPSIIDLHYFKGKIYTLHINCSLRELRLDPKSKSKWMLLETKIFLKPKLSYPELVSWGENLYMQSRYSLKKIVELDFEEMKWVSPEKTLGEYAFFSSNFNHSAAIRPESWPRPQTQDPGYYLIDEDESRKCMFYHQRMWYFPDDCLNTILLDE